MRALVVIPTLNLTSYPDPNPKFNLSTDRASSRRPNSVSTLCKGSILTFPNLFAVSQLIFLTLLFIPYTIYHVPTVLLFLTLLFDEVALTQL